MGSLVTVSLIYYKFSPDSDSKNFENRVNILMKLRRTKMVCQFLGHPVYDTTSALPSIGLNSLSSYRHIPVGIYTVSQKRSHFYFFNNSVKC